MKTHPFLSGDDIWRRFWPLRQASGLDAETFATLGAAGSYDCTATLGAHADQEAMGALAAHDRRLIRAFHLKIP
mgnify:CR=1 FL=1